jgi:ubiquinone/menaquinone biosynthesis C-methylase UbiE
VAVANPPELENVRRYYDSNTRAFERFGQGRGTGTIHRAVWGPGVRTRAEAFQYPNELVARELEALRSRFEEPLHVLDLGCGVGASLLSLAGRARLVATGVTLSGVQAERGRERVRRAGLSRTVTLVEGSFLELPASIAPAHLAFSIEAFVHGPDPAAYFASASRHVLPGGALVVCDDFLAAGAESGLSRREYGVLDEVRRGWLANTLITPDAANALAASAGFRAEKDVDLTPYLELRRPRDRLIAGLVAVGRALRVGGYRFRSLLGGSALQEALGTGLVEFRCLSWRRVPS